MIKILGIVFITLILTILLKDSGKEFVILLCISSATIIFFSLINEFSYIFDEVRDISSRLNDINSYVNLMVKILGISVLAQFVSDLCRDSGEGALATQTEVASKILMLAMTMPLFKTAVNIVIGLLK